MEGADPRALSRALLSEVHTPAPQEVGSAANPHGVLVHVYSQAGTRCLLRAGCLRRCRLFGAGLEGLLQRTQGEVGLLRRWDALALPPTRDRLETGNRGSVVVP